MVPALDFKLKFRQTYIHSLKHVKKGDDYYWWPGTEMCEKKLNRHCNNHTNYRETFKERLSVYHL